MKIIALGSIYTALLLTIISCSDAGSSTKQQTKSDGKSIYIQHCKLCHGSDGSLALNGAKNLKESELSLFEIEEQVTNGKGAMQPFRPILDKASIRAVSVYVKSLSKAQ